MGVWGVKSYQNDNVMDQVGDSELGRVENEDIYQAIGKCTVGYFNQCYPIKCPDNLNKHKRCALGVVMYAVDHIETDYELSDVNKEVFKMAKYYAESLLTDEKYMQGWTSPTKRKNRLKKEIKILDDLIDKKF